MSYLEYFKEAQERTLRLGLKLPAFAPNNPSGPLLTNEAMHSFIADLQPLSSKWTSQDLVNQCLPVHQIVAPVLRGIIGVEPVVTIGHVRDLRNNDTYFFREEEDFRAHLEEGCQENIRQFHVWLTLPSMEILDITLPASYAEQVGKRPDGSLIFGHAGDLGNGLEYVPMMIGTDYFTQCNERHGLYNDNR